MTHPTYTQQALSRYNLPRLKQIATELGVTPTGDKRASQTWVNAIIAHQSTQLQKVDNQALAQAEFDNYIADQAQAIAPELLTIVEISFDHHEYYAGNQLIASIRHDDNHLTQRWVVIVNDKEVFRANTPMRCDRFICNHYKDGSLPVQEEAEVQGSRGEKLTTTFSSAPLPPCFPLRPKTKSWRTSSTSARTTTIRNYQFAIRNYTPCLKTGSFAPVMIQLLITVHNCELQTANCELLSDWWVKRRCSVQQQYSNSVYDAVRSLSMADTSFATEPTPEYLQHLPLQQLTTDELQQLLSAEVANCEQLTAQNWQRLREPVTA